MSKLMLGTNVGGKNTKVELYVNRLGLSLRDENQNICVISKAKDGAFSTSDEDVVALLVFNSDAGSDYYQLPEGHSTFHHEKLYMEESSFVRTDDLSLLDEVRELAANWLFRYLLISATQIDTTSVTEIVAFGYGVYSDHDDILNWVMNSFDRDYFEKNLNILGFQNQKYNNASAVE